MGFLEFIGLKRRDVSLEQVRREEIRLNLKESQTLAKLEKLEREREEIFARGSRIKSPPRRRQLARLYDAKARDVGGLERELAALSKELTTITALKLALERQQSSKEGVTRLLARVDEAKLMAYLEDDKITREMYLEKLDGVLSAVSDHAHEITRDLGTEGREVMDVWQKMDEGEIEGVDAGLKLADRAVRARERKEDGEMEEA
jgi:hypothetical protein